MARTVIIGLDGMPHHLIKNLAETGVMPSIKSLINQGTFLKMASSLPEVSSVAWSSIITGTNPGEHGIYGFTHIIPGTYTVSYPNFRALKAPTFWQQNGEKKYVLINIPFTYPAQQLDGFMVSGFVALDLEQAVYPKKYVDKLKDLEYQIDADTSRARESKLYLLNNLDKTLKARIKTYRYIWDKFDWDVFFFVFTGCDRLAHYLWDAYEEKDHQYHQPFLDHLHQIDQAVGEIMSKMKKNDTITLLSDHGFDRSVYAVNLNRLLVDKSYLKFDDTQNAERKISQITDKSLAFAMDPARIYLNYKDIYPRGRVRDKDREILLAELTDLFDNLKYERQKVVDRIFRKEEIFHGKHQDRAPDLVLLPKEKFTLRAGLSSNTLFERDDLVGRHTYDDAFFLTTEEVEIPEGFCVENAMSVIHLI